METRPAPTHERILTTREVGDAATVAGCCSPGPSGSPSCRPRPGRRSALRVGADGLVVSLGRTGGWIVRPGAEFDRTGDSDTDTKRVALRGRELTLDRLFQAAEHELGPSRMDNSSDSPLRSVPLRSAGLTRTWLIAISAATITPPARRTLSLTARGPPVPSSRQLLRTAPRRRVIAPAWRRSPRSDRSRRRPRPGTRRHLNGGRP